MNRYGVVGVRGLAPSQVDPMLRGLVIAEAHKAGWRRTGIPNNAQEHDDVGNIYEPPNCG